MIAQKTRPLMHISHPKHKGIGLCLDPIEGGYECHLEQIWIGFRHFGKVDMLCSRCAKFAALDFKIMQEERERYESRKR